ncbi:MAG: alcohol dehydrogenase catalytic domain-containing protein [Cyanobacteriota/Melainabacteria group bacterium]
MTNSQTLKTKTEAIRITAPGGPEVMRLEEVDIAPPSAGQARIAIKAAGVNYIDIYQRSGRYVVDPPFSPGLEASGVVEALGPGVESVSVGDRVAFVGHQGCYARDANVDASILIPLPDFIDYEMGAAFPLMGMTTQYLLTGICQSQTGYGSPHPRCRWRYGHPSDPVGKSSWRQSDRHRIHR